MLSAGSGLASAIHAENGVAQALEVLGQPLPLQFLYWIFKILARPAHLMDEHDHWRGRTSL